MTRFLCPHNRKQLQFDCCCAMFFFFFFFYTLFTLVLFSKLRTGGGRCRIRNMTRKKCSMTLEQKPMTKFLLISLSTISYPLPLLHVIASTSALYFYIFSSVPISLLLSVFSSFCCFSFVRVSITLSQTHTHTHTHTHTIYASLLLLPFITTTFIKIPVWGDINMQVCTSRFMFSIFWTLSLFC